MPPTRHQPLGSSPPSKSALSRSLSAVLTDPVPATGNTHELYTALAGMSLHTPT